MTTVSGIEALGRSLSLEKLNLTTVSGMGASGNRLRSWGEQNLTTVSGIRAWGSRFQSLEKQNFVTVSGIEAPGRLRGQKVLYCRHFQASPGGGCTGARKSAPEAVFTY